MGIRNTASGIVGLVQRLVDNVVSPDTRSQFYSNVAHFATQQPILATFLAIQVLFSATPILLFISFSLGTLLLALVTAIVFSLFWIGIALLILVPTLFITGSLGIAVFVWAVSSFLIVRWVYNIIPIKAKGKGELALPNGKKAVFTKNGEGYGDFKAEIKGENGL